MRGGSLAHGADRPLPLHRQRRGALDRAGVDKATAMDQFAAAPAAPLIGIAFDGGG